MLLIMYAWRRWARSISPLAILIAFTVSMAFFLFAAETNLARNGDFSGGLANWTVVKHVEGGGYPIIEVVTENPAPVPCTPGDRRGNPFVSINVPFGTEGFIEQNVSIPPTGARLSFVSWGWEDANPQLGFSGLVNASAGIVDASGQESILGIWIPRPMFVPGGGIVSDVCTGNVPETKSFDLSPLSGQTVKVRLRASSQKCCGTLALFDDVLIQPLDGSQTALRGLLWLVPGLLALPVAVLMALPWYTIGAKQFVAFVAKANIDSDYGSQMAGRYKKITFGPYALGALVAFLTTFYTEIGVTRGIVFQFVLFQALLLILLGVGLALLWTPSSRVLPIFLGETFSNWALVSGSIVLLNLAYILLTYVGLLYLVVVSSAIGTFLLVVTIFVIQRSAKEYLTRALRWREDG